MVVESVGAFDWVAGCLDYAVRAPVGARVSDGRRWWAACQHS